MGSSWRGLVGAVVVGILGVTGVRGGEGVSTPPSEVFNRSGLLSPVKEQLLSAGLEQEREAGKGVQWSWFAPINLSWSWTRNTQFGEQLYYLYSIQWSQPIFQSGAIYYSIKRGAIQQRLGELNYQKARRELVKEAIGLLLNYRITQLELQIAQLQLRSDQLDLERKREQFRAGVGDGGLLNSAGLKVNQDRLTILNLQEQLRELKEQFQTISNLPIEKAPIPHFRLVPKGLFVDRNLELQLAHLNSQLSYASYREQLGKSLVSVNLVGSWNWLEQLTPVPTVDSYYSVGVQLKLPLAPAAYFGVQSQRASYWKSRVGVLDQRRKLEHQYQILLAKYRQLRREERVHRENVELYRGLVADAQEGLKSGSNTSIDLEIIENSLKIGELRLKEVQYKIEQVLLEMNYLLVDRE